MYLNVRTDHSFLRSYGTVEDVINRAVSLGHEYVGIADFLSTWGHIKFHKKAVAAGIKPLLGCAFPVVKEIDKDPRYDLFTVIAKNNNGLKQIYEAISVAQKQKHYRGRLTYRQLYDLKDVVIIADYVAMENIKWLKKSVYTALSPKAGTMLGVARDGEWKSVFAPAPLYPSPMDKRGYDLITKISPMGKQQEVTLGHGALLSKGDAIAEFNKFQFDPTEAMKTADKIAAMCNVQIKEAKNVVPDSKISVEEWARRGAEERGLDIDQGVYAKRLARELDVIRSKNFEDYFLLVADLVRFAREHMFVGPGRGSSGGSLICYLMGITELDPIVHGTLFERFIDPTRSDFPDIDIDFPDEKRELVFDYLKKKYGEDHVAKFGTLSFFKDKSALNDVAKALSLPFDAGNQLRYILDGGASLSEALALDESQDLLRRYPKVKDALLIEGHIRHHSTHAAGIAISAEPVSELAAIDANGTAQLTGDDAELVGLLKVDILGLRSLTVIEDCCDLAKIDPPALYELDFNDSEVWRVFNEDRVAGVFQFEGDAVRGLMRRVTIDRFSDLCAIPSLARPGPLVGGAADEWVTRRQPGSDWKHFHESLREITEDTFGTIVYQEQAMKIAAEVAGFDVGEVNKLRKAVGKKIPEELHAFREKFIAGATLRMEPMLANALWDQLENFGGYAFNYSHAVAYGMIAYYCAYLKAYYPLEFAVAQLRHQTDNEKCKALLRELLDEGYDFVPFDAQVSEATWSFSGSTIYGGFTSVKGVGEITAQKYIGQRNSDPKGWIKQLTPVQRKRLLSPNNTPWHDIDRMQRKYAAMYNDPRGYRSKQLAGGIDTDRIYRINDIPAEKGQYYFIGHLRRKQVRDKNSPEDVNKRDGQKISGPSVFLNLYFEDDSGDLGSTISRFKYEQHGRPIWEDPDAEGKDYLVKASIIEDGRVWMFIDAILEISNDEPIIVTTESSEESDSTGQDQTED